MMSPAQQNPTSGAAALDVIEAITANRDLAHSVLKMLQHAGGNVEELERLVAAALTPVKDALPVAPSTMMEAGTEGSLTAALSQVKELMGDKMVGPDAKIFEGRDLGEIPALPANIMKILNSKCELSKGPTVAETHRLVLLPASIDGVPTTVNSLRKFDAQAGKGKDPSFYKQDWYDNEAFANKPLEKSIWVLLHETVAPGTYSKTDLEQVEAIKIFTNYETATVIALVGTMAFQYRENGEKIFPDVYGRCEERSPRGSPVYAGNFDADGLRVGYDFEDGRRVHLGRAVVRKLNT